MSKPATSRIDPEAGLLLATIDHMAPIFDASAVDISHANAMAAHAVDAYQPQSRADYVRAARAVAFSLAALSLLGQAAARDMPLEQKMRVFGRANALNRSAEQAERGMLQHRRGQTAAPRHVQPSHVPSSHVPPSHVPPRHAAPAEPEPDDQQANEAIAEAMDAYRGTRPSKQTPAGTTPEPTPMAANPPRPAARTDETTQQGQAEHSQATVQAMRSRIVAAMSEGNAEDDKAFEAFLAANTAPPHPIPRPHGV